MKPSICDWCSDIISSINTDKKEVGIVGMAIRLDIRRITFDDNADVVLLDGTSIRLRWWKTCSAEASRCDAGCSIRYDPNNSYVNVEYCCGDVDECEMSRPYSVVGSGTVL